MATSFRRRAPAIGLHGCVVSDQAIVSQIGLGKYRIKIVNTVIDKAHPF